MRPKIGGASLCQTGEREARRVGADDRPGPTDGVDPRQQLALDACLLDDGFEDPSLRCEPPQILVEASHTDLCGQVSSEKRVRLELPRAIEAAADGVSRHVEQEHMEPGVGEVRGDSARPSFRRPARLSIESRGRSLLRSEIVAMGNAGHFSRHAL